MIRKDLNDAVFVTQKAKFAAVMRGDRQAPSDAGQPVLVGTVSVEKSEFVSKLLEKRGVPHVVLNAKFHEKGSGDRRPAGKKGAVTIATNMAGRGTDILLGGNAEFMARKQMRQRGYAEEVIEEAIGFNENVPEEVLEARKVFRDLLKKFSVRRRRGTTKWSSSAGCTSSAPSGTSPAASTTSCAAAPDARATPGSSQFFISFEDDLMRLFGSDRFRPMLERLAKGGEEAIEFGLVSKQIENAQKRVESRNYDIRRHVLQYDDVMNQQRNIIYGQRREVLEGGDMRARIQAMRKTLITEAVGRHAPDEAAPEHWDIAGLSEYLEHLCIDKGGVQKVFDELPKKDKKDFVGALDARAQKIYELREKMWEDNQLDMREFERVALLGAVDRRWMDHIDAMTELRDGIGLRALAQRDPVVEYKLEGFEMFDEMVRMIQEDTMKRLYFTVITPRQPLERKQVATPVVASHGEQTAKRPARADKKVGRNDPCPCGSGKKYKNCCGANT